MYRNFLVSIKYFHEKDILRIACSRDSDPDIFLYSYKFEVLGSGKLKICFFSDHAEIFELKCLSTGLPSFILYADSTDTNRNFRKSLKKFTSRENSNISRVLNQSDRLEDKNSGSYVDNDVCASGSAISNDYSARVALNKCDDSSGLLVQVRYLWKIYISLVYGGLTYPRFAYIIKLCSAIVMIFAVKDIFYLQCAFYLYVAFTIIKVTYAYSKNFRDVPGFFRMSILCMFPTVEIFLPILFTSGWTNLHLSIQIYLIALLSALIFRNLLSRYSRKSADLRFMYKLFILMGVLSSALVFGITNSQTSLFFGNLFFPILFYTIFPKWYSSVSRQV